MSVKTEIDRLNAIKTRIRTNLVAQGITVPTDTMLEEMATMILSVAGEDGYTPVRGTDYWTATDIAEIKGYIGDAVNDADFNDFMTLKTYEVVMNTDVVATGGVTAESVAGILKVGGYIQLKNAYTGDNTTKIFCTINGIQVAGLTYSDTIDRDKSNAFQMILYSSSSNNNTMAQLEGSKVTITAGTWLNFTLFGMLKE